MWPLQARNSKYSNVFSASLDCRQIVFSAIVVSKQIPKLSCGWIKTACGEIGSNNSIQRSVIFLYVYHALVLKYVMVGNAASLFHFHGTIKPLNTNVNKLCSSEKKEQGVKEIATVQNLILKENELSKKNSRYRKIMINDNWFCKKYFYLWY